MYTAEVVTKDMTYCTSSTDYGSACSYVRGVLAAYAVPWPRDLGTDAAHAALKLCGRYEHEDARVKVTVKFSGPPPLPEESSGV
jgi:hypothetical protein